MCLNINKIQFLQVKCKIMLVRLVKIVLASFFLNNKKMFLFLFERRMLVI